MVNATKLDGPGAITPGPVNDPGNSASSPQFNYKLRRFQAVRDLLAGLATALVVFAGPGRADNNEKAVQITALSYDPLNREISVSFTSGSGESYLLEGSNDLQDWSREIIGPITGVGGTTRLEGIALPRQAGPRFFLRVRPLGFALEMVTVGDPGNDPDLAGFNDSIGAVSHEFRMGKFEVTNRQYVRFLNSVAVSDPNALYSEEMNTSAEGGITRSGAAPNFSYQVKVGMENKPVIHVSWFDAVRFCNWLHHGRPIGEQTVRTTEDGAYTLTGPSSLAEGTDPLHGANGRNQDARFHLPSREEWHKAAYYEPGVSDDGYWFFPTRSDDAPVLELPPGGSNSANYDTVVGTFSEVGAYQNSPSFYSTFDQGGNAEEWTEGKPQANPSFREVRGGAWFFDSDGLRSNYRDAGPPTFEGGGLGFRVAAPAG